MPSLISPAMIPAKRHDLALVCGDGRTLPAELQLFRTVGVKHDAFCCGRSLQCYIPFVSWAPAVVNYVWLDEEMFSYARDQVESYIIRHSVFFDKKLRPAIDCLWTDDDGKEVKTWDGTSAFFALIMALQMGYERILLAGVPINNEAHWYEDENARGPEWNAETLRTWGRFRKRDDIKERVRSCSGYTQYLFGEPTIGWLRNETKADPDTRANRAQAG